MTNQREVLTPEDRAKIAAYLETVPKLSRGLGTRKEPCSVAAGNLALTGELTDERPACMSPVVHRWVITMQDSMPDEIRNGAGWRGLLPDAFGSADGRDEERRALLLEWVFGTVLPLVQPVADAHGYGDEWRAMCEQRTARAAYAAADAAYAATYVAYVAYVAARAAADAAADATAAAYVAYVAYVARAARAAADAPDAWPTIDPVGTLRRLITLNGALSQ